VSMTRTHVGFENGRPHVVVTDIRMPPGNTELAAARSEMPVWVRRTRLAPPLVRLRSQRPARMEHDRRFQGLLAMVFNT
jgi:hypothetical protein